MDRSRMECLPVIRVQVTKGGAAQPHGLLQHRLEYRCEVSVRGIYHLQHLGRRGLLLERLLRLSDQSRVLDRDDRLVGEGADQLDLPRGKGFDTVMEKNDDPGRLALAQQRDPQGRAYPAEASGFL